MITSIFVDPRIELDDTEIKRVEQQMSVKQLKSARALIKDTCSNYDCSTGGCLLLDDGFVHQCPQMIRQSVVCKFFRDVLLEDKRAKELKAEIYGINNRKVCAICGGHFQAISNRAKYCAKCAKEQQRKKAAERKRKQRCGVTL